VKILHIIIACKVKLSKQIKLSKQSCHESEDYRRDYQLIMLINLNQIRDPGLLNSCATGCYIIGGVASITT
jgi:hypothetical protein